MLVRLRLDGDKVVQEERMLKGALGRIRDVRQGPDGLIYLLTDEDERRARAPRAAVKVLVVGAGPAGLFFSLLLKRKRPDAEITVVEQNPRGATFGFGVVFSRGALEFLSRDEPQMHARLAAAMESWPIQRIVHRDEAVDIDGNGFSAIARLELLRILQDECEEAGVRLQFERALIARFADGRRPGRGRRRRQFARARKPSKALFKPRVESLTNKFAWYGTAQRSSA